MSREEIEAEFKRREEAGEGCNRCCYCDLGAYELCRGYDLVPFGEGPEGELLKAMLSDIKRCEEVEE